jgi:drug/metabolite transporter, DME family
LKQKPNAGSGIIYVLLATLGWSLSGLFVRLMPELDGWQINCWRGLWMAIGLMVYLLITHKGGIIGQITAIPFSVLLTSALCFAIGTTFYVWSLTLISTATVSVIGATSPLITALLSPWITGEKPPVLAWISAVLALLGMGVIAKSGFELGHVHGLLLSFCVPFTFALQTLLLRRHRDHDMMVAICFGGFLAFILAGLGSLVIGHASAFAINSHSFILLMLMGPVQLSIPLIFFGLGAKQLPAMMLSLIAMLDAVINPFWPWLFLGEKPEASSLMGGAIVLGAVLLVIIGTQFMPRKVA